MNQELNEHLELRGDCSKKSNGSNPKECPYLQMLPPEDIEYLQAIAAIEITLFSSIRKLTMEYDTSLVLEGIERWVEILHESMRKGSKPYELD